MRIQRLSLLILLLISSTASAASISLGQKHIFPNEDLAISFTETGPSDSYTTSLSLAGQKADVDVRPLARGETSTTGTTLRAPAQAGRYNISSDKAQLEITVEPALLTLGDVRVAQSSAAPNKTMILEYTVRNVGSLNVYSVRSRATVFGHATAYAFDSAETLLSETMRPEEQQTRAIPIIALNGAGDNDQIGIEVSYEFDGEMHKLTGFAAAPASGRFPLIEFLALAVIILVFLKIVTGRLK